LLWVHLSSASSGLLHRAAAHIPAESSETGNVQHTLLAPSAKSTLLGDLLLYLLLYVCIFVATLKPKQMAYGQLSFRNSLASFPPDKVHHNNLIMKCSVSGHMQGMADSNRSFYSSQTVWTVEVPVNLTDLILRIKVALE